MKSNDVSKDNPWNRILEAGAKVKLRPGTHVLDGRLIPILVVGEQLPKSESSYDNSEILQDIGKLTKS
jgi:hypothetical protein